MKLAFLGSLFLIGGAIAKVPGVVDVVVGEPDLSTLVTAITAAGLADAVAGSDPITVFAPTDDAFAAVDPSTLTQLLRPEWILHLQNVLLYHTAGVKALSTDLADGMIVPTLAGENLTISISETVALVGEFFGNATVVSVDLEGANGVVHKIDTVMLPSFVFNDLVDVAAGAGLFSTLVSLVVMADLEDTLRSGTFTVLAPTDDAFAKLPAATVDFLTAPENVDALTDILLYHVIAGVVPSVALADGMTPTTVQGSNVTVSLPEDGSVLFNNASLVLLSDVLASNGIAHAIDTVLLPAPPATAPTISPSIVEEGMVSEDTDNASHPRTSKGRMSKSSTSKGSGGGMGRGSKGRKRRI